ncbi:alpha/beta hydrolase [Azotobacter vinelandii]|uniref:alpha/beta hydrolase n=1 Tax=Azotobacter vinelandii TaxID=354 RepID=UPI0026667AFB|nr:alpha/beta hydrolase [Azotobacter vinelandii]WKN24248.1 alpha/beta hydrolase [Azotobacter vinelandii]
MSRILLLFLLLVAGFVHARTVQHQPIELATPSGVLYGSLLLPQDANPVPVALLIAGSGPTDRNGNNPAGRNDSLKRLAEVLARRGIASVRYDKRGVAASLAAAPDERMLSVEGYVADAAAWGRELGADPRFSRLVLIGHSEGALIASLAAEQAGADALVVIAGSGRPIDQVLLEQLSTRLPPPLLAFSAALIDELKAGRTHEQIPEPLEVLFRPSVQPYLISLFRQDPAGAFAQVRIPALIVQGRHDIQVGMKDAEALKAAKPDAELLPVDGMNHVLRIVPADVQHQLPSYNNPELPLASVLGQAIGDFILRGETTR